MEGLLAPIKTTVRSDVVQQENFLVPVRTEPSHGRKQIFSVNGPEDTLEILKSEPDHDELSRVLRWLKATADAREGFNINIPSPQTAQVVYVLVNDIISDYWATSSGRNTNKSTGERLLVRCLSSVTGIGAIVARLRQLLDQLRAPQGQAEISGINRFQPLGILLDVLEATLDSDAFVASVWNDIYSYISEPSLKSLRWKEFVSLVASGKVLSIASEASLALDAVSESVANGNWVGNGFGYATWLGRNMKHMINTLLKDRVASDTALSQLLSKALNLGYTDHIVQAAFSDLLNGIDRSLEKVGNVISALSTHEQKLLVYSVIRVLSKRHLYRPQSTATNEVSGDKARGGVAALLVALIKTTQLHQDLLVDWLVGTSADAVGYCHNTHRAVILALSLDTDQMMKALQISLELFGDKLCIKHAPMLQQEVNAQILLMLVGYAYRTDKRSLTVLACSSIYLNAISNRIAASSPRARFLGMIVGTAVSQLVDSEDKKMVFSAEELSGSDGQWYAYLTNVNDKIGSISDLNPAQVPSVKCPGKTMTLVTRNIKPPRPTKALNTTSKIITIEEIDNGSESELEDLPMYEKPDSDPSDEDDDPTLLQRNRPTAPVYIQDLIAGLRDTENFDRHKLALTTASSLIRRKATFGTEVSDNIEGLATLLVGLSDKWGMEHFQKLRLQGMIAMLTAEPLRMGQWFSMTFYNGDYSMGQRASVLTTLGLGARELAGLGKEDAALTGANASENAFPSKRLPETLHKIYALEAAPMNALSQQLERNMIQPMAAEAADKFSGPNALKVRTFSSRMAAERKRQKPMPNALAKVVAEGFFFPLTGRWRIHLQANGEKSTHTTPFLLTHLLKTLSLILHASGPSTLSLPQMTAEFWDLLLSLRPRATDPSVLEALLFAFLTLLDINENDQRRLAEEHAKELLETQEWVGNVFERIGGGSEEGDRVRMLAAGVLMRTREVVERYQRMLMGDLVDFM
ncbi:hypothetical protein N7G274_005753 [Stereocaulon virgatum]|uniref:Telomere length regulation protein conserved domain-containing protein n=1 Tax=Stereocaulon virgatum TaxID=373712 RepID=A0ABR4A8Y9_9LECA